VAWAAVSGGPSKYERRPVPTAAFTPFEPLVRQLLAATPDMPATVIAERVGWTGSITSFRESVRRLRVEHRPVDPSDRSNWLPGDAAQCDLWFPPKKIPLEDGSKTPLTCRSTTSTTTSPMAEREVVDHTLVPRRCLQRRWTIARKTDCGLRAWRAEELRSSRLRPILGQDALTDQRRRR
jgi:hypothetical protein